MDRKDKERGPSSTRPAGIAELDSTEKGPARLHAPGKPREVESGGARLQFTHVTSRMVPSEPGATFHAMREEGREDVSEAGPARIVRHQR